MIGRIIPTRVGTSQSYRCVCRSRQDHPHACGDKVMQRRVDIDKQGSSPRVWGQEWVALYDRHTMRIIPTRVGTSKIKFTIFFLNQDHPHACGDKPESHIRTTQQKGSSPRVWGQASALNDGGAERGIIPTRVGTRFF